MVASTNADIYSPFQQPLLSEEGPQSSEEGSGLHSPVFGAQYSTHGDSFRYQHDQLDVGHPAPAAMIAPQYDYPHPLNTQQGPMLDTALELPGGSSSARQVTFATQQFSMGPRNQLGIDFSIHSRVPPPASNIDFRYSPQTERPLPGGSSHDHSYARQPGSSGGMPPLEPDRRPTLVNQTATRSDSATAAPATTPTTQPSPSTNASPSAARKETTTPVVIACRQCRSRKIRCDSTRPVCNNCVRRSNECQYDLVPKRRGPDKRPGTRQRSCKKRPADGSAPPPPKRKRTSATPADHVSEQQHQPLPQHQQQRDHHHLVPQQPPPQSTSRTKENDLKRSSSASRQLDHRYQPQDLPYSPYHQAPPSPTDLRLHSDPSHHYKHELSGPYRRTSSYMQYDQGSYTKSSYPRQLDVNTFQFPDTPTHHPHHPHPHGRSSTVPTSPSTDPELRRWWDRILRNYNAHDIATEVTFLVNNTGHLLSFINLDFLVRRLQFEDGRIQIHPAFVYAILAMAKLMKSSKLEGGSAGLQQAIELVNYAHQAYDDAINSGWRDVTLAEAALILALFESSAHPQYSASRAASALLALDSIIKDLNLTTRDAHDPEATRFPPDTVPIIITDTPFDELEVRCACLPPDTLEPDLFINRPYHLPWSPTWTPDEVREEEARRVVWSALSLVSEYVAQCETFNEQPGKFWVTDAANYALLFPGEALDRLSPAYRAHDALCPKEAVYALFCRSMLLWNFCNRFREPSRDEERAEHAQEAFLEAQAIEDALNAHRCNLDTTLIYTCREYLHNTRMLVAQAFRGFHGLTNGKTTPGPMFKRKQAEDWLFYEDQVIQRVNTLIHHLAGPAGQQLTRRPFRITWFINQLAICIVLWNHDRTLEDALKLGKLILNPIDVLNELWPCEVVRHRCESLRKQLVEACYSVGVEGPLPPNFTIPPILRGPR